MFDEFSVRRDFPILGRQVNGYPLVYLDSAATSQKPVAVVNAVSDYYLNHNANVHRAVHTLGEEATLIYEEARSTVAAFIGASDPREVVFVRNTTEAINLVARAWGAKFLQPGDEIVLTEMEHHSNLVPWQQIAQERGAVVRYLPMDDHQQLAPNALDVLSPRTKLVGIVHISNAFGTINPVRKVAAAAHDVGALVLVDGAQSAPHQPVDVQALDADFFVFSGHKMCGPMGIGALWARAEILETMNPFLFGGDMISAVWYDHAEWNVLPYKFEAGTPNVADAVGLAAAVRYLQDLGLANIRQHERDLTAYALKRLSAEPDVQVYGPTDPDRHAGVVSFNLDGVHPHDLGTIVDQYGIAIRVGHHCCHPAMRKLGISGTARASFYLYSTRDEVDRLVESLGAAREVFARA